MDDEIIYWLKWIYNTLVLIAGLLLWGLAGITALIGGMALMIATVFGVIGAVFVLAWILESVARRPKARV